MFRCSSTGAASPWAGRGGPDSQLVMFRASPGEDVTVRTRGQQQQGMLEGGGARPQVNVKNIMVADMHEATLEAMRSEEGEEVQITTIQRNRRRLGRLL